VVSRENIQFLVVRLQKVFFHPLLRLALGPKNYTRNDSFRLYNRSVLAHNLSFY
jgi:hypothetical protein